MEHNSPGSNKHPLFDNSEYHQLGTLLKSMKNTSSFSLPAFVQDLFVRKRAMIILYSHWAKVELLFSSTLPLEIPSSDEEEKKNIFFTYFTVDLQTTRIGDFCERDSKTSSYKNNIKIGVTSPRSHYYEKLNATEGLIEKMDRSAVEER